MMMMQILQRAQDCADHTARVQFGESTSLEDALKELATGCFFEDEVVLHKRKSKVEREGRGWMWGVVSSQRRRARAKQDAMDVPYL